MGSAARRSQVERPGARATLIAPARKSSNGIVPGVAAVETLGWWARLPGRIANGGASPAAEASPVCGTPAAGGIARSREYRPLQVTFPQLRASAAAEESAVLPSPLGEYRAVQVTFPYAGREHHPRLKGLAMEPAAEVSGEWGAYHPVAGTLGSLTSPGGLYHLTDLPESPALALHPGIETSGVSAYRLIHGRSILEDAKLNLDFLLDKGGRSD